MNPSTVVAFLLALLFVGCAVLAARLAAYGWWDDLDPGTLRAYLKRVRRAGGIAEGGDGAP